jgi:hypothetical protein
MEVFTRAVGDDLLTQFEVSAGRNQSAVPPHRLLGLRVCDRNDGCYIPAACIVNERLGDQKFVVL